MTEVESDTRALAILKEVHNLGAGLYNDGDPIGAFRLYEGSLRTCAAFLAHRPAIQQRIRDGLAEVDRTDGGRVRAYRLHEIMEDVRADLKSTRVPTGHQPPPPSAVLIKLDLPEGFQLPDEYPGERPA